MKDFPDDEATTLCRMPKSGVSVSHTIVTHSYWYCLICQAQWCPSWVWELLVKFEFVPFCSGEWTHRAWIQGLFVEQSWHWCVIFWFRGLQRSLPGAGSIQLAPVACNILQQQRNKGCFQSLYLHARSAFDQLSVRGTICTQIWGCSPTIF